MPHLVVEIPEPKPLANSILLEYTLKTLSINNQNFTTVITFVITKLLFAVCLYNPAYVIFIVN